MSSGVPPSVRAVSRALYRSLLRTANKMPDDHRRALVVFRARSEFDKSNTLTSLEDIQERQTEGEIYKDQLEFQAQHLQALAHSSSLLIPVDIRAPSTSPASSPPTLISDSSPQSELATSSFQPTRPSRPFRPPRRNHTPLSANNSLTSSIETTSTLPTDRKKLLRAFQSRREGAVRGRSSRNRFMEGPEPSWVLRKRKEEEERAGEKDGNAGRKGENKHEQDCQCGSH